MTNKQIFKHIRALAHEECANCHAGNCALTDERCHIINTNYQSVQDGAIDCDYFLEVVLPADWDLQDLVAYALWQVSPRAVLTARKATKSDERR